LRDLASNQTKIWFDANKHVYDRELKQPAGALAAAVSWALEQRGIPLVGDAKRSLFRIHRDVRFSNDKTPYKTNTALVWFRPGSAGNGKPGAGVLYFQVGAESMMGAAFYMPSKDVLESVREGIRVRPDAFLTAVAELAGSGLALGRADSLTCMPRGFEDMADTPVAEYLRMRSYVVERPLTPRDVGSGKLIETLADFAGIAMPLLRFGWRAVDEVAPDSAKCRGAHVTTPT